MSEWNFLTLRQAGVTLIDCDHKTPIAVAKGHPYITIPQMKDGRIDLSDVRFISAEDFETWTRKAKPQAYDVVLSRRCNPGETAHVPVGLKFALGQNLVLLRSNNTAIQYGFLRWLVRSPAWWEQVHKFINVGAIFTSLKCGEILDFKLPIPPRDEQEQISIILSAIDEKVENLRSQNQTLDKIAQTLFNHWFIDFEFPNDSGKPYKSSGGAMVASELGDIPDGWRVGKISDLTKRITKGTTPKEFKKQTMASEIKFVKVESIKNDHLFDYSKFAYIDEETYYLLSRSILEKNDILYTIAGTIGRYVMVSDDILPANTNQAVAIIKPDCEEINPEYLLCYFNTKIHRHYVSSRIVQAVQANLSLGELGGSPITIPDCGLKDKFHQVSKYIFLKKESNQKQIQTLTKTRDTLLPKLMSGQIRVAE